MSSTASTPASALLEAAAKGSLPDWAEVRPKRHRHTGRVGELMGEWADRLHLAPDERTRWRATGWLHDALRDADPETLRAFLDEPFRSLPPFFLHGPAAAARLALAGIDDQEMLEAIRYHTLGHAGLAPLGRVLIVADFLEPGRPELPEWRASLRARMPEGLVGIFAEVVEMRLRLTIDKRKPLRPEFVAMWNSLIQTNGPAH